MPPRKKKTTDGAEDAAPVQKAAPKPRKAPAAKAKAADADAPAAKAPATRAVAKKAGAKLDGKNLVIVESPAKAKTINKYLGNDFKVLASYGHVRDLPRGRKAKGEDVVGINIAAGWIPRYEVADKEEGKGRRSAKDILAELRKEAERAPAVYLATDPDREGEAIAWHLEDELGLDQERTYRITFNEITRSAVQRAIANPGRINMDRVKAQEARRMLDRVVGYPLSGLVSKKVTPKLSAGRVQSVAVRLVVDREREIRAFKAEEYWEVHATLIPTELAQGVVKPVLRVVKAKQKKGEEAPPADTEKQDSPEAETAGINPAARTEEKVPANSFVAQLAEWQAKKFECKTEEAALAVANALLPAPYAVAKIEQKDRLDRPLPPFTTSTLQQQASLKLRFAAKKTMQVAQKLYEGVELGADGTVALITYMRTDSVRVSEEALTACRGLINQAYGPKYLPAAPNRYQSGKSAQEGHEAIRPTDLANTPAKVKPFLPSDQFRLYELIYNRFVACQMTPAVFAVTNVEVKAAEGLFKAQGRILKFDGYRRVYTPGGKIEDAELPPLKEGQPLSCLELVPSQHFTQPPPRYNEASLVKTLEKEGIGRPSTYASIIDKIERVGYVRQIERRFHATELGETVTDILVQNFPRILDMKFTSQMETDLDQIENATLDWRKVLNDFYAPFRETLREAEASASTGRGQLIDEKCPKCGGQLRINFSKLGKFIGCSNYPECKFIKREGEAEGAEPQVTEFTCPDCGKPLAKRMGKYGEFYACTGYPECKTIMNIGAEGKPVPAAQKTEYTCEKCGKPMVLREGRRGPFLACTGYPKCKNAKDVDAQGRPLQPIDTGVVCDKCGSPMAVRKGPRGPFLGCTAYPKCKNAKPVPEELKEKLKELLPPPPKKPAVNVEVTETCPECGGPMKPRQGRKGYFLGCAKYPKCKGTREAPPEVLEQLQETGTT